MGGEPLLHPEIIKIVELLKNKQFTLLSNICVKNELIKSISNISSDLWWLININYDEKDEKKFFNNLNDINKDNVSFSITLYPNENRSEDYTNRLFKIFDTIKNDHINIRISTMTPANGKYEIYDYTNDLIDLMTPVIANSNAKFSFDCKVNSCEINYEFIDAIKNYSNRINIRQKNCLEKPVFDILTDCSAVYCSSANSIKLDNIFEYKCFEDAQKAMIKKAKDVLRKNAINSKCITCNIYNSKCDGMCIAKNLAIKNYDK
jgi:organic radical activating enzyme